MSLKMLANSPYTFNTQLTKDLGSIIIGYNRELVLKKAGLGVQTHTECVLYLTLTQTTKLC